MDIATPLNAQPYTDILTEVDYLEKIYTLLVIVTVIMVASFVHSLLRSSFRKIRGDLDNEK